jgi:hypothetical protein
LRDHFPAIDQQIDSKIKSHVVDSRRRAQNAKVGAMLLEKLYGVVYLTEEVMPNADVERKPRYSEWLAVSHPGPWLTGSKDFIRPKS